MVSSLLIHGSLFLDQDRWPSRHILTIIGDRRRRERVKGRCLPFRPSPPSFTSQTTLSLSLSLIVSIYSQSLTSIKCSVTMTTLAALGHRVASTVGCLAFSSVCPFPACPFRSFHVVFLTPSSASSSLFCLLLRQEKVSQQRGEKAAVRSLIWSCQTYQSCPPA